MSAGAAQLRLFVAAYPPVESARQMLGALAGGGVPPHRATTAEQVHLTLQFIGETRQDALPEVEESVRRACAGIGPFTLEPTKLISLPRRGPARLVACETSAPAGLLELHRRLARRLSRHARDRDRFLPHLTLCRFSSPIGGLTLDRPIAAPAFEVHAIKLMNSHLLASGAVHRQCFEVGLDSPKRL